MPSASSPTQHEIRNGRSWNARKTAQGWNDAWFRSDDVLLYRTRRHHAFVFPAHNHGCSLSAPQTTRDSAFEFLPRMVGHSLDYCAAMGPQVFFRKERMSLLSELKSPCLNLRITPNDVLGLPSYSWFVVSLQKTEVALPAVLRHKK